MLREWIRVSICCGVLLPLLPSTTGAVFLDGKLRTLELKAKAQARVSIRLQNAEGFTEPDVKTGDLVQQRNMVLLEVDHNLESLTESLDVLYPFRALKLRVKYHLVGRFIYEGVYDYGPQIFQDVKEEDRENITSFQHQYDLWEFYCDLSRGPFFIRVGRQNLAWGETDIFRLLDGINPLDNTWGGPFEDLDDRRVPLWMLRGSYSLGDLGPFSNLSVEGFWVPGSWDAGGAPIAPQKTPYAAPFPPFPMPVLTVTPDKTLSSSRWGVRLMGILARNLNLSVAHYKTFLDTPAIRIGVKPGLTLLVDPADTFVELSYPSVQITGGSMNFYESRLDAVVRAEVAWFWNESVLIPDDNLKLSDTAIPLPPALVDVLSELTGIPLAAYGFDSLPINPTGGTIPKKDILRFMIGFDKNIWIRPLNRTNMFILSLQYFGQWVPDYDERMRQPLALYPSPSDFAAVRELESTFTLVGTTFYRNGAIVPQLAVAYDVRGAWLVQPSVNLIREPFRLMLQYSAIAGNFTGLGAFRDRDQITLIFTYLLN